MDAPVGKETVPDTLVIPTEVGGVSAVICAAGKTTGVLLAAKACPSAGVLVSILASEVLAVACQTLVAAFVGKGKLATSTGILPLDNVGTRSLINFQIADNQLNELVFTASNSTRADPDATAGTILI